MRGKRCPYCGKRVSYVSAYGSRRKAEYVCQRCGKESRVIINKLVIVVFLVFFLIAAGIMAAAIFTGMSYNPLFIPLVALPLIIFLFISPKFVSYEPLKKYKKSMEAKKAGIEYSDNLVMSELEPDSGLGSQGLDNGGQFNINSDLFNKIKAERTAAREKINKTAPESDSEKFRRIRAEAGESYVHIIKDVSENQDHSYSDEPLKKIHSEGTPYKGRHYINEDSAIEPEDDVKEYKKPSQNSRQGTNKYTANRKL